MAKTEYPNALEMEKKLLSALMMYGGEVIPKVAEILSADDFYRPEHKFIYQAIVAVADTGVQVDVILVQRELEKRNLMQRIGLKYLLSLPEYEFTNARALVYAEEIKEKAAHRAAFSFISSAQPTAAQSQQSWLRRRLSSCALFRQRQQEHHSRNVRWRA